MKPREPVDDGQQDLFRAQLDQIIDMKHPKVVPAQAIDWDWLAGQIGAVYKDGRGSPLLPVWLMACTSSNIWTINIWTISPTRKCASASWRTSILPAASGLDSSTVQFTYNLQRDTESISGQS